MMVSATETRGDQVLITIPVSKVLMEDEEYRDYVATTVAAMARHAVLTYEGATNE